MNILDVVHHSEYGYGLIVLLTSTQTGVYYGDYPNSGKGFKIAYGSPIEKQETFELDKLPITAQIECLKAVRSRVINAGWQNKNLIESYAGGAYWRWIKGCQGELNYGALPGN